MKTLLASLLLLSASFSYAFAQSVHFNYDSNGNRVGKTLIATQLKSGKISDSLSDLAQKELKDENDHFTKPSAKIYPNPTRGIIKIELLNIPDGAEPEFKLLDMSGNVKIHRKNANPVSEIDISALNDGMYILVLKIGPTILNWKIVKAQ